MNKEWGSYPRIEDIAAIEYRARQIRAQVVADGVRAMWRGIRGLAAPRGDRGAARPAKA